MTAKEQIIGAVQTYAHNAIDDLIVDRGNAVAAFFSDKIKINKWQSIHSER